MGPLGAIVAEPDVEVGRERPGGVAERLAPLHAAGPVELQVRRQAAARAGPMSLAERYARAAERRHGRTPGGRRMKRDARASGQGRHCNA